MKKKNKLNLLPISFIFMIIAYIFIYRYFSNNFSFTLAEMHIFLTTSKFVEICNKFTRENLNSYFILASSYDIVWPITYCSFFFLLNFKINRKKRFFNLFNILIILTFFFDMLENITTLQYLQSTNNIYIILSVICTNVKWLLFFMIFIYLLIGLIKFFKKNTFIHLITKPNS